jgi:hypothetical protein
VETARSCDYCLDVSRRSSGLILLALAALAVVALTVVSIRHRPDVNRRNYVRANLRLLAQVPAFPGAKLEALISEPWQVRQEPFGRPYVAGYNTRATYSTRDATTAAEVERFYRQSLNGWRIASWGTIPEGWPRVTRSRGTRHVVNRGYGRGVESVSVDLLAFLRNGRLIRGGRFTISVDYRGYEPRQLKFVCCAFVITR